MARYTVVFFKTFKHELRKLSKIDQKKVMGKIVFLENNPRHPSLHTKKLEGDPDERMESRVSKSIRIIWRFFEDRIIVALDVGHHDVLKKY